MPLGPAVRAERAGIGIVSRAKLPGVFDREPAPPDGRTVCTPIVGRIGDLAGKRRMFLVAAAALVLGSLVGESPVRAPGRFTPGAAALLAVWLSALLLALSGGGQWGWGSAPVLLLAPAGFQVPREAAAGR